MVSSLAWRMATGSSVISQSTLARHRAATDVEVADEFRWPQGGLPPLSLRRLLEANSW